MQLACGVVYVNKVTEERQEDKEKDREKWKIPAGTWSHQGASPGGERIKKKVIDIHFNPQLTTCHPIFSPETRKKSYRALGGQCEWTVGSRKKERKEEGERDLIPQTGWHTERNSWSPEKLKTIWDLKRHAGDERCMKNSMNWGKTKSCKQGVCFARVHALAVMSRCVCVSITSCSPEEALTPSHGPFLLFLSFFPPLSLLCGSFKVEQKRPGSEMGENERGGVSGALIRGRLCVEMQTGKASALLLLDNYQWRAVENRSSCYVWKLDAVMMRKWKSRGRGGSLVQTGGDESSYTPCHSTWP